MTRAFANGLVVGLVLLVGLATPRAASHPPLTTTRGAVASDHPEASRVGARMLAEGGNAIDAAVATALALGVVNPSSSGLGGGGFAIIWDASEGVAYAVDFRETAPAALGPDDFVRDGELDPTLSRVGGLAVGVPGEVAGLETLWRRHGALPWAQVVEPALRLAADGFEVHWFLARAVRVVVGRVGIDDGLGKWLAPRGEPLRAGQRIKRSALAWTLEQVARSGAAGFYRGPVADDLVAAVRARGGVMTLEDLQGYQVVDREPLEGTWNGMRVVTMPLPSSGGLQLLEMLGILDAGGFDLAALGAGSSAALHVIAEVLKHGFADRARLLGDDPRARALGSKLLEPARLARLAGRIRPQRVQPHASYGASSVAAKALPDDGGTSHLCAVDADGNAVALTTTVNGYFGSGVVGPRSGVVLNNEIDDFSLAPGRANMFGLVQSEANLVGPGKRPLSSMTPALLLRDGVVVGCFGGSGGPKIISNTFQTILNVFAFGMDVRAAIEAPRIHHQWLPDALLHEPEIPADVVQNLERRGHALEVLGSLTAVQAVVVGEDGVIQAASDARKAGAPAAP